MNKILKKIIKILINEYFKSKLFYSLKSKRKQLNEKSDIFSLGFNSNKNLKKIDGNERLFGFKLTLSFTIFFVILKYEKKMVKVKVNLDPKRRSFPSIFSKILVIKFI